ncbi:MAG: crotonase/enoyl-CoA hydratase family protein [Ilumatobacter sp.]|uniref:crotonase/enoyl-CoA hydratase family protein n=1 Tax=Ilumatobacter sp. TaxID=1967498 RepID=UPI00391ACAE0
MSENSEPAVLTERRGRVLLITLNRPDAMNAINGALSSGLVAAVEELDGDPGLTAGVLTGAGRGFCSGMDLKAFSRGEDIGPMMTFIRHGSAKPLIGAIEGFALAGGLELALACDLLVAAKGVKLGIPEAGVGLFAAGGGLLRLPSRVGYGKAMEMALTADPITAEEAFDYGLVARITEKGDAVAGAIELAERIAKNAPLAVAASKRLIQATQGATDDEFYEIQNPLMGQVFGSNDAAEGPRAFAEKRAPEWTGS